MIPGIPQRQRFQSFETQAHFTLNFPFKSINCRIRETYAIIGVLIKIIIGRMNTRSSSEALCEGFSSGELRLDSLSFIKKANSSNLIPLFNLI